LGGAGGSLDNNSKSQLSPASGDRSSGGTEPRGAPRDFLESLVADTPAALAALARDGRLVLFNDAFCRLFGETREALLSTRLEDLVEREPARRGLEALAATTTHTFEAAVTRTARRARCLRIELQRSTCRRCAAILYAVDVGATKRLEAALADAETRYERLEALHLREAQAHRESERRLQFALDAARMGTWSWDPVRDVAEHDARAKRILDGVVETATFEVALRRHLPAEAVARYTSGLERVLDPHSGDHHFEEEIAWRRRSGEWSWVQMTGEAHFDGEGRDRRVTIVTGTVLDITTRKRNEEALEEASRQKDRFLATLAHELRNPLAPLYYAAELLERGSKEQLQWARGVIERQVSHMTRLIDDLLDISRISRGQLEVRREPIAVANVVHAAIEASYGSLKEHGQTLHADVPEVPIIVRGDLVRLSQVVTNLLKNAAKFSIGAGHVRLAVRQDGAHTVCLTVEDEGAGIAAEDLPHVFEMFYRGQGGRRMQGGLGVGLYLVRRLVELHDGTVDVHSDGRGRGAVFTVRLPVEHSSAVAQAPPPQPPPRHRRPRRVLIVDDNRDSADALAKLLSAAGDEVRTAYEGWSALDEAASFKPGVVLLDLGMPTLDGYEVCRRIRKQPWGRGVLMIALTGWGRAEDRRRTREAGFDAHLVKPVSVADVEALMLRS
jgi:PAS domain S-box-containing protein